MFLNPSRRFGGLGGAVCQDRGLVIRDQGGVAAWGGDLGRTRCPFLKPGDGLGRTTPLGERAEGRSSHVDLSLPLL